MILIPEGLLHMSVIRNIFHVNKPSPPSAEPLVDFPEQIALRNAIKAKAHIIAENVRTHGEQKFGPMWAQGYVLLPDGRIVFLQQSLSEAKVSGALEINIAPVTDDPASIHIRYDLGSDVINTYEVQKDGVTTFRYGIYDQPNHTEVATRRMLHDILVPVDDFTVG